MRVRLKIRVAAVWRRRWARIALGVLLVPLIAGCFAAGYYYVSISRMIDERLVGERQRVLPRVFARPLQLRRGQAMSDHELIDRLNDLGYTARERANHPGEFAIGDGEISLVPRSPDHTRGAVRILFRLPTPAGRKPPRKPVPADQVRRIEIGGAAADAVTLDAALLTSLYGTQREKRRPVALGLIPPPMVQAALAIEDHRFYEHPGIDPIGMAGAMLSYLIGRRDYLAGGSTITQQLVRNVFLPNFPGMDLRSARARSLRRKALEMFVSVVLTLRASKDEILELYLNAVPLGQRGSFAIHGVSEAARLFFGKDVTNLSLAEAATIAGVIQLPSALSPFSNPERCFDRRNVVLHQMVDVGFIPQADADQAAAEPLRIVQRALETEAPYFVDYIGQTLAAQYPGIATTTTEAVDVYSTLDLHLQRLAQNAVRDGLARVDKEVSRRRRPASAEAALLAVDPRTGEILAMVGGRSYNQSQYNRVISARRQPGSVFKPFVFLTAFEKFADQGATALTPASIVDDAPTSWEFDEQVWTPENYEQKYDGPITFRRALAQSRNIAAIKVAEQAGYGDVAALWRKVALGSTPRAYPSIALGVFEATPYDVATAYTLFPNLGTVRPLQHILKIERAGRDITKRSRAVPKAVARADTTFLVTNMMRGVINDGTGAGARAAGFTLDAAGKTGTTNDLRDAWFVGFTPELLTVVWVGFDDNQPLRLTGARAALPIWTQFMRRALAGHADVPFEAPDGVNFVDIDPETGQLANPSCPRTFREAFVAGTEPALRCELHQ
jgi:penicillin-binding protein 1B